MWAAREKLFSRKKRVLSSRWEMKRISLTRSPACLTIMSLRFHLRQTETKWSKNLQRKPRRSCCIKRAGSKLSFMDKSGSIHKKIVVIGGGTGTFTVLSGLKHYHAELTAIGTMADNGGSTGRLRDEFGVLPPGDLRQCLVALSEADTVMRKLFNHRYEHGDLAGHNFGNIFISTLEQVTGSLDKALHVAGKILQIHGQVIPVTLDKVRLVAELKNGKVLKGESALSDYQLVSRFGIKKIYLAPKAKANPEALRAIMEADLVIVGPGNLYASLIPNFLVHGVGNALVKSGAKKVYIANLMNKN